jgi:hypothetical protein
MDDFSPEQMQSEYTTVLDSPDLKHAPKLQELLRKLFEATREGTLSRPPLLNYVQLAERLKLTPTTARVQIVRLRRALVEHYKYAKKDDGDVCLSVHRDATRGHSGYALRFEAFPGQLYGTGKLDLCTSFWVQKIIRKVRAEATETNANAGNTAIVFSNEGEGLKANIAKQVNGKRAPMRKEAEDSGLWTGAGEVVSIFALARMFCQTEVNASLFRSNTFVIDRSKQRDQVIIFLGSSLGMKVLRDLRRGGGLREKQRFVFDWDREPNGKPRGGIFNQYPEKDVPDSFFCEGTWQTPYHDYALISYFYEEELNCIIIGVGGISTLATEAAVRELTENKGILKIYKAIGQKPDLPLKEFEVVLKVEILKGEPGSATIVATSTAEAIANLQKRARPESM